MGAAAWGMHGKHVVVLLSQSHKNKAASVSPPQPLLNVFTRAPHLFLSVFTKHSYLTPGQYKKAFTYPFLPLHLAATQKSSLI